MLRRFRRNCRGSVAVEFALVALVFFALLFAIIETAIMFFASQVLKVSQLYTPSVGYVMGKAGVTLNDTTYTRPRQSTCVFYSPALAPCPKL